MARDVPQRLAQHAQPIGLAHDHRMERDAADQRLLGGLAQEFLELANQVRPVPYVRSDWFVSIVTQPPLYEDFLQLPRTIKELETLLGVDSAANLTNAKVVRAGLAPQGRRGDLAQEGDDLLAAGRRPVLDEVQDRGCGAEVAVAQPCAELGTARAHAEAATP